MVVPKKPKPKKLNNETSPGVTNFILVVVTFLFAALASVYWLQQDVAVQGQRYWLMSRAAAVAAYLVMSTVLALGIILSHPRNKETWRLTVYLLPWHQALMAAMFALIGLHIFFTAVDSKSGISWGQLWFPAGSQYHPFAMILGSVGLYLLIITTVTAALRKKVRLWILIHRLSWLSWIFVFFHGVLGGTDTQLRPMFWWSGLSLFVLFFWRHWGGARRKPSETIRAVATEDPAGR